MSKDSKTANQEFENVNKQYTYNGMPNDNREIFKLALSEALATKIGNLEEEVKDTEIPPPSKRHKIRMNRLFRERFDSDFLPFPEVDNLYERIRGKLVIKLKINQILDHRK